MNSAHLHLVLNHIPVTGCLFAFCLLTYATFKKNYSIANAALTSIIILALISIAVYFSGEEAEHIVSPIMGINKEAMENHEEIANISIWIILINGVLSTGTLLFQYEKRKSPVAYLWINLIVLTCAMIYMILAGNSGGEIRHSEINFET